MTDDITRYPTIMNLKTIEKQITSLIKGYEKGHLTYLRNIKNKNYTEAKNNLDELNQINNLLITFVTTAQSTLKQAVNEGSLMQKEVSEAMPKLKNTFKQARRQNVIIDRLNNQLMNIDGEYDSSSLERNSNIVQYNVLFIGAIIVILITIKTYISQESNLIENIILAVIIIIIIYYIYKKIFSN